MTKEELQRIESRCRYALRKNGQRLEKQRYTTIYFHPEACRYRITAKGEKNDAGYTLKLSEVMQTAGIV